MLEATGTALLQVLRSPAFVGEGGRLVQKVINFSAEKKKEAHLIF